MKIFLAGTEILKNYPNELKKAKYQLTSFYNVKEWLIPYLNNCKEYLLDSGAFSFMNSSKTVDFDDYIKKYINFINKYDVRLFFELDLDNILGYNKTLELRKILEFETGKKCIPVWHKSRGIKEWENLCKNYNYVAIGGIVTKELKPEHYKYFPKMIKQAHSLGAKVHGLGFTSTSYFDKIRFDSVDSTTWNVGGKFGNICVFNPKTYMKQRIQPNKTKVCVKQKELMIYNWNEWIKFQNFAESYL